jgi:hypothetical protein
VIKPLSVLVLSLMVFGCATAPTVQDTSLNQAKAAAEATTIEQIVTSTQPPERVSLMLSYKGERIPNTTFDLPVEMNPAVEKWIHYFTGKGRERFEHYLARSEYFIPFLKPVLQQANAPEDLVYLAMIESGFNNRARSHAKAVGAWQFIPSTGRRYGLSVNWWVDERRDVLKSTQAAVQFLKELNNQYGSWHLAAAAYNAGPGKIQRAIKKHRTTDFWEMCRYRYLKPETKNYVPKLFAAAIIAKNRKHFGFKDHYVDELKEANADKNSVVGRVAPTSDEAELGRLPDQLDEDPKPVAALAVDPADVEEVVVSDDDDALLAEDSVEKMLKGLNNDDNVLTPHVNKNGVASGEVLTVVDIPSPANLLQVAKAAGMSYNDFKSINPELLRWVTPPQMKQYRIKVPLHARDSFIRTYFAKDFDRSVDFLQYKARRGDSVRSIARRFKINPDPVAQMNGLKVRARAPAGRLLELPIPRNHVRSLASLKELELYDPPDPKRPRARRSRKSSRRVYKRQKTSKSTAHRYRSSSRSKVGRRGSKSSKSL